MRVPYLTLFRQHKVVLLGGLLAALIAFFAWPVTSAQSPLWEVWVVNGDGQSLPGMTVVLSYQNYSAEADGHSEEKQTDKNGYVIFSPRNLRASRGRRILQSLHSAEAGVHASFGPHAWVFAFGNGLQGSAESNGFVTDWTGTPPHMASTITATAIHVEM
jgi:hypothetical protein